MTEIVESSAAIISKPRRIKLPPPNYKSLYKEVLVIGASYNLNSSAATEHLEVRLII